LAIKDILGRVEGVRDFKKILKKKAKIKPVFSKST